MCIFLGHVMTNGHVRKLLCVKMKPENDNEEEASITNGISNDVTNVSQISEMVELPRGGQVFGIRGVVLEMIQVKIYTASYIEKNLSHVLLN